MRLPYIQIAMELIEQSAPDVAVELDADEAIIGWGLVKVIRWSLGRCPDYLPPSSSATIISPAAARMVARAAGWAGDPDAFVDAVARVQPAPLWERIEGGIRIRGLDRYDEAWNAAKARSEKAKAAAEKRWSRPSDAQAMPEHCSADARRMPSRMPHDAQTQTQTQTQVTAGGTREPGALADGIDAIHQKHRGAPLTWNQRNQAAVRGLLGHPESEVLRRWEIALQTPFPRALGLFSLVEHWDTYAAPPPSTAGPPRRNDVRRGVARAEDADHSRNVVDPDGTINL